MALAGEKKIGRRDFFGPFPGPQKKYGVQKKNTNPSCKSFQKDDFIMDSWISYQCFSMDVCVFFTVFNAFELNHIQKLGLIPRSLR